MKKYICILCLCTLALLPCRGGLLSKVRLNPFLDRYGEIFPYTRHYFDECDMEVAFALCGKSMAISQRGDPGAMIPNPLTMVPGLFPLGIFEKYVACPLIDTVLLPYDFFLRCRNHHCCGTEGVVLKVMQDYLQPATNMEFSVRVEASDFVGSRRVVYNGDVMRRSLETKLCTDENGELYIPVKVGSYESLTISNPDVLVRGAPFVLFCDSDGRWSTSNKFMPYGAEFGSSLYLVSRVKDDWFRAYNLAQPYYCFNCKRVLEEQKRKQSSDWMVKPFQSQWNKDGVCLACAKSLTQSEERVRIREFALEMRKLTALFETDVDLVVEHTGMSRARVKELLGFLPDPVMRGKNVIKVNLREETAHERLYAGKSWGEYYKSLPGGVLHERFADAPDYCMPGYEWVRERNRQGLSPETNFVSSAATLYGKPEIFSATLENFTNANFRAEIRSVLYARDGKAIPVTNLVVLLSAIDSLPANMPAREKRIARGDVLGRKELPPEFLVDELSQAIRSKTPDMNAHPILCNDALPLAELERAYSERRLALLRARAAMMPSFHWEDLEKRTAFISRFKELSRRSREESWSDEERAEALDSLVREALPAQMPRNWRKCLLEARKKQGR